MLGDVGPAGFASEPAVAFGPGGEIAVAAIWIPAAFLPVHVANQFVGFAAEAAAGLTFEQGGQNAVWFSEDGTSFRALHNAVGRLTIEGHQGNQDADVAISPTAALHVALYGPNGIEVLTSRDQGETWQPGGLVSPQAVDRQWIEVTAGGELLVAWRGLAPIAEPTPADVGFARSLDDGRTWEPHEAILGEGYARGPLVRVGQSVVLPVNVGGGDGLAIALGVEAGDAWSIQSTGTDVRNEPGFVVPLARADGSLMLTWTDDSVPARILAVVLDPSGGWSEPMQVSPSDRNAAFAWPVQRSDGATIVFYYEADGPGPATSGDRDWRLGYAMLCQGASDWRYGTVVEGPVHHGAMCFDGSQCSPLNTDRDENDRSVGEIFEAGVAADGRVWVTWTATTDGPVRSNQIWITGEVRE